MFKTIINAMKVSEVRKRILYTLLLLVIFRFGTHISVPYVNYSRLNTVMQSSGNGILGLINLITGGAFARLSLFALSISPYISSSIIVQLLAMVMPSLEAMMREGGEQAKKKIDFYTKTISLALATMQGIGLYLGYSVRGVFTQRGILPAVAIVLTFVAGTSYLVWLGEKITKKGIGNGISMLIFAGIVASVPNQLIYLFSSIFISTGKIDVTKLIGAIGLIIGVILLITAVVYVYIAERRIPVQYARKIVGRKMYGGQNTHIPLKLIMAGVMPIIFASSFITFPAMIIQIFGASKIGKSGIVNTLYNLSIASSIESIHWGYLLAHAILYMLLIVGFTFFYTLAMFNPAEVASVIRQNGGFIPGIRAGKPTTDFLTNVTIKLTAFGSLCLCIIAVIPMLLKMFTLINLGFGGTSILIIVGVALETVQQLDSQLMVRKNEGFL